MTKEESVTQGHGVSTDPVAAKDPTDSNHATAQGHDDDAESDLDQDLVAGGDLPEGEGDGDEDYVVEEDAPVSGKQAQPILLTLKLPKSLANKLRYMAQDEGIAFEELAFELIAEGMVIRAWEIVEKKSTMRGGNSSGNQSQGNNRYRSNNNQRNNNNGGGGGPGGPRRNNNNNNNNPRRNQNIHNIMEDKASFMEYVRNQEKKRR